MFICKECGAIFDTEQFSREVHDELPGSPVEVVSLGCPDCGGAYGEACVCEACGDFVHEERLFGGKYCKDCALKEATCENFLEFVCQLTHNGAPDLVLEEFIWIDMLHLPEKDMPSKYYPDFREFMIFAYNFYLSPSDNREKLLSAIVNRLSEDEYLLEDFICWIG